ncbi:hypothetical protein C5167_000081 [Papaver somniferum]|uniref:Uncharacterized protein n=1 Tax=Papaver somniferum TaxID=3469 RepID=A0A4Y7KST5_PAPSO|nr:light-harvesting complex-like protein OHP1, chloroplastic [Papaver somniferum]RZC75916.1 hypothetical protein C5167_000081 [Papaver somniferum]
MTSLSSVVSLSSSFVNTRSLKNVALQPIHHQNGGIRKPNSFRIRAAKPPAGVVLPKVTPKFNPPFQGFTKTAEVWNSRACMIGLIGTFIVELILNKGILEMIGVEIGKGLDLPL